MREMLLCVDNYVGMCASVGECVGICVGVGKCVDMCAGFGEYVCICADIGSLYVFMHVCKCWRVCRHMCKRWRVCRHVLASAFMSHRHEVPFLSDTGAVGGQGGVQVPGLQGHSDKYEVIAMGARS